MVICRNAVGVHVHLLEAEGVNGNRKVGNPWPIQYLLLMWNEHDQGQNAAVTLDRYSQPLAMQ